MHKLYIAVSLLVLASLNAPAYATLINSTDTLSSTYTIDFSQFGGNSAITGSIQVGDLVGQDVTLSAENNPLFAEKAGLGTTVYGLGDNGDWDGEFGRNGFAYLNNAGTFLEFTFGKALSVVGGLLNYTPNIGIDVLLEAYDINGVLLESHALTGSNAISTPFAYNEGEFRGIARDTADIFSFRIWNSQVAIDDLTFSYASPDNGGETPVPAPGSLLIILLAMLGMQRLNKGSSAK